MMIKHLCFAYALLLASACEGFWILAIPNLLNAPTRNKSSKASAHNISIKSKKGSTICLEVPIGFANRVLETTIVWNTPRNPPQAEVLVFWDADYCFGPPFLVVKLNNLKDGLQIIDWRALGIKIHPKRYRMMQYDDPSIQRYVNDISADNGVWYKEKEEGMSIWIDVVEFAPAIASDAIVALAASEDVPPTRKAITAAMYSDYAAFAAHWEPRNVEPVFDPLNGDKRLIGIPDLILEDMGGTDIIDYRKTNEITDEDPDPWRPDLRRVAMFGRRPDITAKALAELDKFGRRRPEKKKTLEEMINELREGLETGISTGANLDDDSGSQGGEAEDYEPNVQKKKKPE